MKRCLFQIIKRKRPARSIAEVLTESVFSTNRWELALCTLLPSDAAQIHWSMSRACSLKYRGIEWTIVTSYNRKRPNWVCISGQLTPIFSKNTITSWAVLAIGIQLCAIRNIERRHRFEECPRTPMQYHRVDLVC